MNSKLKFAPFSNKVIEGFEYSPSSYAIAKISCPPNWEQSGPYNNSSICTNNCDGTLSYINAKSTGYNSDDTTNYCDSAKVYNPMDKEGFKNSSNNLTKGLAPKIQTIEELRIMLFFNLNFLIFLMVKSYFLNFPKTHSRSLSNFLCIV